MMLTALPALRATRQTVGSVDAWVFLLAFLDA
jgi:hypothetical protein